MKKTIIKTALITFAVLLTATAITIGSICLFAPATTCEFLQNAGKYKSAMNFAVKAYEKENSNKNLQTAVDLAILTSDSQNIVYYGEKMLAKVDLGEVSFTTDYVYHLAGKYSVALCENKNFEKAVKSAVKYSLGYGKLNPTESVILWGINNSNNDLLQSLLTEINAFKQSFYDLLSGEAKQRLDNDIKNLTAYLNR